MKLLLLDTHILLWWLCNSHRLRPKIRKLIANPDNEIYISPASTLSILFLPVNLILTEY